MKNLKWSIYTESKTSGIHFHDDVTKWKHFPQCREFTGHQWIPCSKASDVELCCFLWSAWTNRWVNSWDKGDFRFLLHHCNVCMNHRVWLGHPIPYFIILNVNLIMNLRFGSQHTPNILPSLSILDLYRLSAKMSYCQVLLSLKAVRLDAKIIKSLWNLTSVSAALLPRCQPNFWATETV